MDKLGQFHFSMGL